MELPDSPGVPCEQQSSTACKAKALYPKEEHWLNLLPLEVSSHIAVWVFHIHCSSGIIHAGTLSKNGPYQAMVSLAESSAHLCKAVQAAFGDFRMPDSCLQRRWEEAMGIKRFSLNGARHGGGYVKLRALLGRPWNQVQLDVGRKVSVKLNGPECSKSVEMYARPSALDMNLLMETVFAEGICELSIRCKCFFLTEVPVCFMKQAHDYLRTSGRVSLPKVEKLVLDCQKSCEEGYRAIWDMFTGLRIVQLHGLTFLTGEATERLQDLDAIRFTFFGTEVVDIIPRRGQISNLQFDTEVQQLSEGARITSSRAFLTNDTGAELVSLPSTLQELHLDLGRNGLSEFFKAIASVTCELVQRSPNLSVLRIHRAAVPLTELGAILEAMSEQLLELEMPMWHGNERITVQTLMCTMEHLALWNCNVRKFMLHMPQSLGTVLSPVRLKKVFGQTSRVPSKVSPVPRMRLAFSMLRKRASKLDMKAVERAISTLIGMDWERIYLK